MAKQSGGHVFVDSSPGGGARFRVLLPWAGRRAAEVMVGPSIQANVTPDAGTILLVEDEPQVRAIARQMLEDSGYHVLEAGDVEEALRIGASHPGRLDLLLADVVMPGMSGPQIAARLAPVRPEMRILYMSGYMNDTSVHRSVVSAGQALLAKPFTAFGLAHEVRKALR